MKELARVLIVSGIVLVVAGVAVALAGRFGLGRLPGDLVIRRPNATFYFPLATSLLISVLLSLLFWIFRR